MSKKLKCLGLNSSQVEAFVKHNISCCKDVLNRSSLELVQLLKIPVQFADDIIYRASRSCAPAPGNALEILLYNKINKSVMKTTLDTLDEFLNGGLPCGMITEISGPPGCGKTQFCMMLAVVCAENKSVLFIDTEGAFDAHRFLEIARSKFPFKYNDDKSLCGLASKVFVYREKNMQEFMARLENLEEEIVENKSGLIIIDSVASLIRREFDPQIPKNMYERNKLLSKQAAMLKLFSSSYNIPVILTNQITTQFRKNATCKYVSDMQEETKDETVGTTENNLIIALGYHWSHCINTRIILHNSEYSNVRQLHLVKSPNSPYIKLNYTIESSGIQLCDGLEFCNENDVAMNVNARSGMVMQ